jgi:hypothetical protein
MDPVPNTNREWAILAPLSVLALLVATGNVPEWARHVLGVAAVVSAFAVIYMAFGPPSDKLLEAVATASPEPSILQFPADSPKCAKRCRLANTVPADPESVEGAELGKSS